MNLTMKETEFKATEVSPGVFVVTWTGPISKLKQSAIFTGYKADLNAEHFIELVTEDWMRNGWLREEEAVRIGEEGGC